MKGLAGFLAVSIVTSMAAAQGFDGAPVPSASSKSLAARQYEEVVRVLRPLVESYGVSGMEAPVRATVERLLPRQIRRETDSAGNLWVTLGRGDPTVVFIAHLDEVGFRVSAIGDDGTLELEEVGGIFPSLWEAKPALVHTERGTVPAVFMPRDSTDAGHLTHSPPKLRADVGTSSREGSAALGITVGNTLTMPKQFVRLAGSRATGRSFDDRVGSTAQILAVRGLDAAHLRHRVIFIWSVREEVGLEGAQAAAHALGLGTARVHAIDTFVSADSPLEISTFAVVPLGQGAVARALDNSSVTPPAYVDSLIQVARRHRIPLQVGTTNGGNDGSVFGGYGVPDVPIGWPLRYAHSPAETIDLRDVESLAELIRAVAEDW